MGEPLTIYVCPQCGAVRASWGDTCFHATGKHSGTAYVPERVRVFREDDLLSDRFVQQAFFPLGPDDPSLIPVAQENMRRALALHVQDGAPVDA